MRHLTVTNLVRQEATTQQKDYWKQIIPYGDYDNFPLRLARLVQNSTTGASCIDTKADFIEGAGFSDPELANKIINGLGERFGDIHSLDSSSFALNEGFALNIKYNAKAQISEIYSIPFEYCRFGIPDSKGVIGKIKVNQTYGLNDYKQEFTQEYDVYNPDPKAVLAQQARDKGKYKGQILYCGSTGPLYRFYPSPSYYSAHEWMDIEDSIGVFHKKNIDNGFFQTILFKLIGDPNEPSTHPDDVMWNEDNSISTPNPMNTRGMRFNIEMQKFLGAEKANVLMAQWGLTKEEMPSIEQFPTSSNSELFKTLADLATEVIARATKVPAILANISSGASLGGDGNNIRASVKLMQQRVIKPQSMFERVYSDLLSKFKEPYTGVVKILHYNPFPETEKIDPLVWAALSVQEQRKWIKNNTAFELDESVTPQATPAAPANSFQNVSYSNYPEGAKVKAQKAKKFVEDTGSNCGTPMGRKVRDEIIAGSPLSFKTIKRINNFLSKNESFKNHTFSDSCESLLFSAWGGDDMLIWSKNIISSINE